MLNKFGRQFTRSIQNLDYEFILRLRQIGVQNAWYYLCRDDIVSWYLSKSSQREGSRSTQDLERQLADRVKKNVYYIQSRIAQCKISTKQKEGEKQLSSCDQEVKKLVEIATSAEKIAAMPLNYEGWL